MVDPFALLPPRPASRRRRPAPRPLPLALLLLALLGASPAWAQLGREVQLELGYAGEVIADRWNPLRLTSRDLPPAELEIVVDRGSLREGPVLVVYRARVPGGSGVRVFEDDLFVPSWRALSWTLASRERVWASGSVGQRLRDPRPLHLLLSGTPGRWRALYPDAARVVEINAPELPERAAAYDGVASLLIDGSAAAPRADALAAAAASGTPVLLLEPLTSALQPLTLLAPQFDTALGAGRLQRRDAAGLGAALAAAPARLDDTLVEALAETASVTPPAAAPQTGVLLAAAAYALVTLLLLQLGGAPGLLAALALAALASAGAWRALQPPQRTFHAVRAVELGADALAYRLGVRTVLSLPAGEVALPLAARALAARPYTLEPDTTRYRVQRWSRDTFVERPRLVTAQLRWHGDELRNHGERALRELTVKGLGPQGTLPGGAVLRPRAAPASDAPLPDAFRTLWPLLPDGAALALSDADAGGAAEAGANPAPLTVVVALPPVASSGPPGAQP